MSKKGGYVIVDLKGQSITAGTPFTLDGVTARLNRAKTKACLLSGFAIGDEEKRDVFVDLQKTDDGYVALFGQYTMTINDDEVTITDGGVLLDNIVDSQGHKRFIEGEGTVNTKITDSYCKWSLSGSHLLVVLGGSVADGTAFTSGENLATFNIPIWVAQKIVPLFSNSVERKSVNLWSDDYQAFAVIMWLQKVSGVLRITSGAQYTISGDKTFRVEFDLLIDSESEQEVNYNGN